MSQRTVAVVQARMGSTRLPGKVLLPIDDDHVLSHVVRRIGSASEIDNTIVATSTETSDDIIPNVGERFNMDVYRGSEANVRKRMFDVAAQTSADYIVRITADCPLIDPETITEVAQPVLSGRADYAANIIERTFPRGLDVEAFTFESFQQVHEESNQSHHREHVTPYYRENPDEFNLVNVTSDEVFDDPQFQDRTDLRLTLDEADDYEVLREIYENVDYNEILPIQDAIRYADENGLMSLNAAVEQKTH